MAEPIGALRVELSANTITFEKDMGKARRVVKRDTGKMTNSFARMRKSVGNSVRSLVSLRAAAVAAAGVAGLGLLSQRSIAAADNIAKTADKLGIGIEALQELRFAANRAGVEQRTLDLALQRLARRTGEAAKGTGELRATLEEYNIAVKNADGSTRSTEDVLIDLADAIQGASSDSERLRIAFKAFDSEGAALVNLMREGAAGVEAFRLRARQLGIVLDADIVREAEKANDELTDMGQIIKVAGVNLGLKFMPAMRSFAGLISDPGFIENVEKISNLVSRLLDNFRSTDGIDKMHRELAAIDKEISTLADRNPMISLGIAPLKSPGVGFGIDTIGGRLDELRAARVTLAAEIAAFQTDTAAAAASLGGGDGLVGQSLELRQALSDLDHELKVVSGDYASLNPGTIEAARTLKILKGGVTELGDGILQLTPDLAELDAKISNLAGKNAGAALFKETRTEVENFEITLKRINDLFETGNITNETRLRAAAQAWDELNTKVEATNDFGIAMGQSFGNAFEEAILGGKELGDVLKSLEQDLLRLALRKMVTEPIFGFLGSLIPEFATGGSFTVGGEGGTDANLVAFKATRGEQVSIKTPGQQSAERSAGAGGGAGVVVSSNVTVNVHAPAGSGVDQQESTGPGGRTIDIFIDEATASNIGRPGSRTRRALEQSMGASPTLKSR